MNYFAWERAKHPIFYSPMNELMNECFSLQMLMNALIEALVVEQRRVRIFPDLTNAHVSMHLRLMLLQGITNAHVFLSR